MNLHFTNQQIVCIAGIGQIILATCSITIPKILNWRGELTKVQPLIKQIFWTYACYILMINLCFGLVSAFAYTDLCNGSRLAVLCSGFIAAYWISRILTQFFYFDRSSFPKGKWYMVGETLLVMLFVFLASVYSFTAYHNYQLL